MRCTNGSVYDVVVDIRKNSETFSYWAGIELNSKDILQLWIPEGFAHGFLSLQENTVFEYKVNNFWSSEKERTIIWNDSFINISWPKISSKIDTSQKDAEACSLEQIISNNQLL